MKKVLVVLPSHDQLGNTGQKTGFWLEEFTDPYYKFIDSGYEVTLHLLGVENPQLIQRALRKRINLNLHSVLKKINPPRQN